jgi:hypothetical protein
LLFDAGPFGSGHQHEDKLHLVLCAYGRPLLLDAGNYMYDRSRWRRYVLSTRGHNTIRVDDQDQCRHADHGTWVLPQPFRPLRNTWASTDQLDYAVGRCDSGYGPKRAIRVVHTRAVLFVKPDYWLVVDTLDPQDPKEHRYESLFHLGAEHADVDKETGAVMTRSAKDANLVVWPLAAPDLGVTVVKGLQEEPVQGWANGPWRPVPTAVITRTAAGKVRMTTVLYPLAPGVKFPIRSVAAVPVTAEGEPAGDAVGVRICFSDGVEHTLLVADRPGVRRQCGGMETTAELCGRIVAQGKAATFEYPK